MQINGTLLDHQGCLHTIADSVSFPKLIKHAVLAGLGPGFAYPSMIASWIGLGLFSGVRFKLKTNYIQRVHPIYDPDEISMMSKLVGRSIADIYSKSHYGATFTICYEHCCKWAGVPAIGPRPDFLSIDFGAMQAFSVEAKGFSKTSVSAAEFTKHKTQSTTAHPIFGAAFGVASITYDIYSNLKVKIEDPPTAEAVFDEEMMRYLASAYLRDIRRRLQQYFTPGNPRNDLPLSPDSHSYFEIGSLVYPFSPTRVFLIVPESAHINENESPAGLNSESLFVDRDGIGVWLWNATQ